MSKSPKRVLVSVIIPVYNTEKYLQKCLDSVFGQTVSDIEVIAINDGSTDNSLKILNDNAQKDKRLRVISQENTGQGTARNRALDLARGEFILFVDSDDFIEPLTLELTVARAQKDSSDMVHFDWKLTALNPEALAPYRYFNTEPYGHKYTLEGGECDELLQMTHFFSVNRLYRKAFLEEHAIRYGESRVYEDTIFVLKSVNRANRVSILDSPLYIVHKNMESSTNTHRDSDKHHRGFVQAIKESLEVFEPRTEHSSYYFVKYLQRKFIRYYTERVPFRNKGSFLREYIDIVAEVNISVPKDRPENILRLVEKWRIFEKKRYWLFRLIVFAKEKIANRIQKIKKLLKKYRNTLRRKIRPSFYGLELRKPVIENSVVFFGFDRRHSGNSRYLFEELRQDKNLKVYFVTDDKQVDDKCRIEFRSDEYYEIIARSKYIIAETWVPLGVKKRKEAVWIQLWHGTPLKRMLFDSSEREIMLRQPKHKVRKYRDIMRWDYLVADSAVAVDKFRSAFLMPEDKIIQTGYPRVKYLKDNNSNDRLKAEIKKSLGLTEASFDKKIVFYAPTWRDYNYGKKEDDEFDTNYILNIEKLASELGNEYIVLFNNHNYMPGVYSVEHDRCVDVSDYETQDILLITDTLITDYSSILFDALAVNKKLVIYSNDFEKYQESRGVYEDMWSSLGSFVVNNEEDVKRMVMSSDKTQKAHGALLYSPKSSIRDVIQQD